jgi:hypothetical protein
MSSQARIIGYCRTCGKAIEGSDEAGTPAAEGILYCAEHAPQARPSETQPPPSPEAPPADSAPPYHAASSPYAASQPPPLPDSASHVSPGLAFVLGFIPGVGAIYNGQYAKGLVHVVIFGSIISILSTGSARGFEPLFGLLIPTFVFYMAFEAYHTAKKRREGQAVDEFSGLVQSATNGAAGGGRSRFPVAPVLLIAFGVLFLLDNLEILKIGRLIRYWPGLLIALGLYLLYERVTEIRTEVKHDRH